MVFKDDKVCPSSRLRFNILAPSQEDIPWGLTSDIRRSYSSSRYEELLFGVQKLRGKAYSECPTMIASLTPDGRHYQGIDLSSWHVLLLDVDDSVVGCCRYRSIPFDVSVLQSSRSPLAKSPITGPTFRAAFEQQFEAARRRGVHYGEVGAWALTEEIRHSVAAVNIALMIFALAEKLGGGLAVTTATTRHRSAAILRRLGGTPIGGFAPYYDPQYECTMELLQFDSQGLSPRFGARLEDLSASLRCTTIHAPVKSRPEWRISERQVPAMPGFIPAMQNASNSPFAASPHL